MSIEEMRKAVQEHDESIKNKTNKGESEMTNNNEVKEITKVLDISREFVENFYATASIEDQLWIEERMDKLMKEKGDVKYFAAFRSEFAKKFFPELVSTKVNKKKESLLETLRKIRKDQEGTK